MRHRSFPKRFALLAWVALLAGCERHGSAQDVPTPQFAAASARAQTRKAAAPSAASQVTPPATTERPPLPAAEFSRLFRELSEPDAHFFSTNYVSNETSYLQVAEPLARLVRAGGVYLGVGPEQNFTYIALSRPALAFVIDIRRQNALLHLLYKAIFDAARTRSEFLALLLGRPFSSTDHPPEHAELFAVFQHTLRVPPNRDHFLNQHARLVERIQRDYRVRLSATDREILRRTHEAFFERQLETRFELAESGRKYPTLREILAATTPSGRAQGFLATESAFRLVQRMHRQNRIIPVVGDFAGSHALQSLGRELERRRLTVSVFYVSNVEQYVLASEKWRKWVRNVRALPSDSNSLFLRCYLDQGKRHPEQLPGHRTATVLQLMHSFLRRQEKQPSTSFWQVATDEIVKD
jgi:hypothetical protein